MPDREIVAEPKTDPLARTEAASVDPAGPAAQELPAGTRIGRYVVLKKLGSGGMGVVYAAFDEELDRRVALKFLQAEMRGSLGSGAAMLRLQREAQVMAKLSHPNVVAVFDVGTFEGQVFLAMELVDGLNLRSWLEAKPRSAREIVAVYLQAGRGLEAAHAAGILHRDFKPDNVIIDAAGRVRVLDFGVARIDDSVGSVRDVSLALTEVASTSTPVLGPLTTEGELVGTPAYMAPEQLQGKRVDSRSDQFAFCIALYEALYGVRPHDGATLRDLIANVSSGRVKAAPGGGRKVPRGVRSVLVRGLRPNADERFASMGDLIAALEKQIAVRRNVAVFGGAALVAGAAALGVALRPARPALCVGAEQEIARSWGDKQRADVERALLLSKNPRAKDVWERIRPTLDDYAAKWAAMRTESCQATRVRGVQSDEALDLRSACLDQRQRELSATVGLLATADARMVDRAVSMVRDLPDIPACADVASLRTPYAEPKDPGKRRAVDAIRGDLAQAAALVRARKNPEAEVISRKAASDARDAESRTLEALANYEIGASLAARGKDDEARASLIDSAVEASSARDDVTEAMAWTSLVKTVGYDLGHFDEAELYSRLAGSAVERAGSKDALLAHLLENRADVLFTKGELEKSEALYAQVLEISKRAFGEDDERTAHAQIDLADFDTMHGRAREALPLYESAVAKVAAIQGEGSPSLGLVLIDYTQTLVELGKYELAIKNARRALASIPEGDVAHALMRTMLACALLGHGDVAEAKAEAAGTFAEYEVTSGADSPRRATARSNWAIQLARRHFFDDALREADVAIALLANKGVEKGALRTAEEVRARSLSRTGHPKEGLALGTAVLAEEDKESQPQDGVLVTALLAVGEGALGVKDVTRAITSLERGALIAERSEGGVEEEADMHLALARALLASRGDAARARSLAERAAREYDEAQMAEEAAAARAAAVGATDTPGARGSK